MGTYDTRGGTPRSPENYEEPIELRCPCGAFLPVCGDRLEPFHSSDKPSPEELMWTEPTEVWKCKRCKKEITNPTAIWA